MSRETVALPARVQQRIAERQARSEVVIGWVQLGVVLVFSTLYFLSPSAWNPDLAINPTPWFLSAYVLFTLFRLWLAYRGRLPDWMLVASVIVDMALLLGLIWSFHLQYEQPPSFYLKAPTLLYVFVFIALRTLRFEVRYIVLAGTAAALGWAIMVGYAVWVDVMNDPDWAMVTRDYIKYMTSNSILIGAEFDKILSIVVVTAILALAVARARETLVMAAMEQTAAEDLSRFVPSEVAHRLLHAESQPEAGETEHAEATVLFVDIEGFTSIGESLSPEQLVMTLNEYFETVCAPIRALDGVVTQFQGDAILASFNLPSPNADHAANAIRAGLIILHRLNTHTFVNDLKLKARIGINSGMVVGGLVGTRDRLGYTIHGDSVNLASRLEAMNKETNTRMLVAGRTVELATAGLDRIAVTLEDRGETTIRGHQHKVRVYSAHASNDAAIARLDDALTTPTFAHDESS